MNLIDFFEPINDPRRDQGKRHKLHEIIALTICAVISGADSWVEIEEYGQSKQDWLVTWLELPHGIPSHDTLTDLFARIKPEELERAFQDLLQSIVGELRAEMVQNVGVTFHSTSNRAPVTLQWGDLGGTVAYGPFNRWLSTSGPNPNPGWGTRANSQAFANSSGVLEYGISTPFGTIQFASITVGLRMTVNTSGWGCF